MRSSTVHGGTGIARTHLRRHDHCSTGSYQLWRNQSSGSGSRSQSHGNTLGSQLELRRKDIVEGAATRPRMSVETMKKTTGIRRNNGQAMVEFALCIPFLLLFVVAIIYFGRLFYTKQIVVMAAQEGARLSSRMPNLDNSANRDYARGFGVSGEAINIDSPIYRAMAAGHLLTGTNGETGNLPAGSSVEILPWDDASVNLPPGVISVRIKYPFTFMSSTSQFGNSFDVYTGRGGSPISFANQLVTEQAVASQEVF